MDSNRTFVIGDPHGCLEELKALLVRLRPHRGDSLVFVGDLVDKGPDSAGVVRLIYALSRHVHTVVVRGNHELRHLRAWQRQLDSAFSPNSYVMPADSAVLYGALSPAERAFLNSSLSYYRIPGHNMVVVHGGIPGSLSYLPHPCPMAQTAAEEDAARMLCFTRYLDRRGRPAESGELWAKSYDGRFGHVCFGHTPFQHGLNQHHFPHATGVDFGCVVGGLLGALVVEPNGRHVITVKAKQRYYMKQMRAA